MAMSVTPADFAQRSTKTQAVLALFQSRPLYYFGVHELAEVGGFAAWRTRVADCRAIVAEQGGNIVWNGNARDSRYCYVPHRPLGSAAEIYREPSLF